MWHSSVGPSPAALQPLRVGQELDEHAQAALPGLVELAVGELEAQVRLQEERERDSQLRVAAQGAGVKKMRG